MVASNPARALTKPLLVYDGDCGFCKRWVVRWQAATGDAVDYAPYQEVAPRFGHIPVAEFGKAVHLLDPDGRVSRGASAALRTLKLARRSRWLDWSYRHVPGFAAMSEAVYRFVARHRGGMATLDRWVFGEEPQLPSYFITRGIFLRLLGVIYLIAFCSIWVQVQGLIGSRGLLPVADFLARVDAYFTGRIKYGYFPTLCWFNASDGFLNLLCGAGALLSLLMIAGLLPAVTAALLFAAYLSLSVAGQAFLGFQWDALLLEAGFLAILLSPLQWRLTLARPSKPPAIMIWMVRWLAFRVMFLSGVLKWTAGDVTWQGLTAMQYHYETQPLPPWTAWNAHWLPQWFQVFSALMVFIVEALVPLLYFMPRRLRVIGVWITVVFQCLIMATGNYGFFNLLTIVVAIPLLDDQSWPRRFGWARVRDVVGTRQALRRRWPNLIVGPLAVVLLVIGATHVVDALKPEKQWGPWMSQGRQWAGAFRIANGYGLFRIMTTSRPEIIIEGSDDGVTWRAYEFKWKAGDPKRRPAFCIPHMPRLDWQMWFAALGPQGQAGWLIALHERLLEGSPQVLGLLGKNPFPDHPPAYVRAVMYDYHFSDGATRRRTGAWWLRRPEFEFLRLKRTSGGFYRLPPGGL
jgi:lipase maturation factor 1